MTEEQRKTIEEYLDDALILLAELNRLQARVATYERQSAAGHLPELREQAKGGGLAALQALINGLEFHLTVAEQRVTELEASERFWREERMKADNRGADIATAILRECERAEQFNMGIDYIKRICREHGAKE